MNEKKYISYIPTIQSNLNNAQIMNQSNQTFLINDNIILREDINRLSELNQHLENELKNQRSKNYELANQNDKLNKSNLLLSSQIDNANCLISQAKIRENNLQNEINKRSNIEELLKETEIECQNINKVKNQIEIDYKILLDKYNRLKEKSDNDEKCLIYIKNQQDEKMNEIDEKLNKMFYEIESLKQENSDLRISIDNTRKNNEKMNQMKVNYNEKLNEEKLKNNLLNKDLEKSQNEFEKLKNDLNEEILKKQKEDEIRKEKAENKLKMVFDLQRKIEDFKKNRIKSKENLLK